MKAQMFFLPLILAIGISPVGTASAQQRTNDITSDPLLKRFDKDGDGKISDAERQAAREKLRQMRTKPGAMTPSGKTESVGDREVTEMEYASSDGRKIPCVLSMPKGDGPFPALVTIHGGQGNRDLGYIRTMAAPNQLSPTVAAFNEQPWAILAISYRAGNGALFGMEQDDVVAGIRFAKTLPKIDPARVGVIGGSHGGHLALVAAERMGKEFLCVAAGSPWMTDPVVYMTGDPDQPPLSLVPAKARDEIVKNGRHLFKGLTLGRGMSEQQAKEFIAQHSIEASADKIVIPSLFITSRGDDQAPHVLIEPMINRMKTAGKDVTVYTAEKSPHGFYWARTVSAARALRGEKTKEEENEEKTARETIITFFSRQFARTDAKAVESPKVTASAPTETPPPTTTGTAKTGPADPRASMIKRLRQQRGDMGDGTAPGTAPQGAARPGRGGGASLGGTTFETLAGDSSEITLARFKQQIGNSPAFASRPEIADRLFDRLDADRSGSLSRTEFEGFSNLRGQFGRGGAAGNPGMNRGGTRATPEAPAPLPPQPAAGSGEKPASDPAGPPSSAANPAPATRTSPVRIGSGQLVGEQHGDVRVFRGIPYAAPPVGELRWRAPQPHEAWNGVREALAFGSPALQGDTFFPRTAQSEDCLFLNLWAPSKVQPGERLPVLFWIHGGAFIQGSGTQPRYDGSELARRGVVVVTINYRLGPLGLFAHPALTAEAAPGDPLGNYCLLDMMEALRWVQRNIGAFGGDPGNVTISGSSAGGTSCLFLMGIPAAQGLFHKAIIHSSGGMRNILDLREAEAAGVRLAERLKVSASATAADLRKIDSADIALSTGVFRQLGLPVKPVVDGRLVTGAVADTFAQGKQARIPVLMGAANGESGARQLGDEVATGGAFGFQLQLADNMIRDGQPVYLFQLTFVPPKARAGRQAATHGESVAYGFGTIGQSVAAQFGLRNDQVAAKAMRSRRGAGGGASGGENEDANPVEDSAEGRRISEAMMDYWAGFMRTGQPHAKNLPEWPAFSPSAPKAMVFGNSGIESKGFRIR